MTHREPLTELRSSLPSPPTHEGELGGGGIQWRRVASNVNNLYRSEGWLWGWGGADEENCAESAWRG